MAFLVFSDLEAHAIAFLKRLICNIHEFSRMKENILPLSLNMDKTKALIGKPDNRSFFHILTMLHLITIKCRHWR